MELTPIQASPATAALGALAAVIALLVPSGASAEAAKPSGPSISGTGKLTQLRGGHGCLVDRSQRGRRCTSVRALRGPAPFLGSNAVAISPDGRNVYVASSKSNAIAVFERRRGSGRLSQRPGAAGCIADKGRHGCREAVGLLGPNSVAVSADGKSVYATARGSGAVTVFSRTRSTGALTQATDGSGCISNAPTDGCTTGRALEGADVVVVSPDGTSVYVGAFFGNAVAVFARDPATGALTQPADASGCLVNAPTHRCTTAFALEAPEGMAISGDGNTVYVATAVSNALLVLSRDRATGALTQATDGSGCISNAPADGCTTGVQLAGANAIALSPGDDSVYVTSLFSNSLTSFARDQSTGALTQLAGTEACVIYVLAVGCSLSRALEAPEGLAVSPDGDNVYAAAFASAAVDVLNRNSDSGAVIEKRGRAACVAVSRRFRCTKARGLLGVSSVAVSPDGRHLYSGAFASDAVGVFKRVTKKGAG